MVVSDPVLFATATSFERKAALADIDHKQLPAGLVPFLAETTKSNQKIFLGELGIGLINASINLALMINEICPKKIIFIGLGGALTEDIGIGDIVCAESVFQHDSFRSKSDGKKFFLKPGVSSLERDDHIDPKLYTDKNLNEKILNLLTDFTKNKIAKGVLASGSEFVL
ncbi:MAG: hypothetical protein H6618_08760 [Deltaproteobacteria bacterium]|nr:hypothetical protein [Deltaproteobacteria bacterium]